MGRNVLTIFFGLILGTVTGQEMKITLEEYILAYKELAVREMKLHRIPASITLAQGILESANGNSTLAKVANNHFGIKCHKGWEGPTFSWDDDHSGECFRKYGNSEESYRDHSVFLTTRDRYRFLFDLPQDDYKAWAYGLKQAGYATNPRYPELLIKIIEENRLFELDKPAGQDQEVTEHGRKHQKQEAEPGVETGNLREVFQVNDIPYIIARQGDTDYSIAREFNINAFQVRKYNEKQRATGKNSNVTFQEGERVFLEPRKRKSGKGMPGAHSVAAGEDMAFIGRQYGIWTESLYKLNGLQAADTPLTEGQRIRLR